MSHLTRAFGAVKLAAKAQAPTIMVVSGIVSMGASVVLASKQTLQLEEVLAPHVKSLEDVKLATETAKNSPAVSYTNDQAAKDRGVIYGRVIVACSKLYFVPSILFVGGAALVFGGHRIMLKRNATLALAFTSLKTAYDSYRENVRESFGEEADRAMVAGSLTYPILNEKGEVVGHENRLDWGGPQNDPYNRIFERGASSMWIDDLSVNKMTIANQQRMAQILLGNRGYLYLSEVYESLGFPETDVSRVVGWKDKRLPDGSRDIPIVDFGLDTPLPDDWKYTADNAIYLDFNCQGLIIGGQVQKELEKR